jgi:hypothetical protein
VGGAQGRAGAVGVVCAVSLLAARLAGWGWSAGSDPPPTFSPRLGRGWAAGLLFGGAFFCTTTTPPPPPGCSIVDPVSLQTTHCIELEDNEAALRWGGVSRAPCSAARPLPHMSGWPCHHDAHPRNPPPPPLPPCAAACA